MRSRRVVFGVLAMLLLGGTVPLVLVVYLPEPTVLEVGFRDGSFSTDLFSKRVSLTFTSAEREVSLPAYRLDGSQAAVWTKLPAKEGRFRFLVEGFRPAELDIDLQPLTVNRAEIDLESTSGRVIAVVADAKTGDALPRASLAEPRQLTSPDSRFALVLPPGRHDLRASASGYCDGGQTIRVSSGREIEVLLPLSPHLTASESARLVLDWAENPRDLDAHILVERATAPIAKPHVYFAAKRGRTDAGELFANLDIDYRNSEGFETATLSSQIHGTYRYFVHLYAGEGSLGASEATVSVSTRGCKRKVYRVPNDCRGRFWSVVDIKVADSIEILERGQCSEDPPRQWSEGKGQGHRRAG